ncbi:MAG: hypothetical protein OEV45_13470 [Desulfobacteraceae bacterium]|nr:hypothetical protein [Desulfobacteraceae bacterium]
MTVPDFAQQWIEKELNGYGESENIPDHRECSGQVRGWNPYRGWVPVIFADPKEGEFLSKRKTGQSFAELEELIKGNGKNSYIHMPFSQEVQKKLSKGFGFQTNVSLFVSRTVILGIVEAVRTIILNWALKLEEEGILGEGLSFSKKEKEAAIHSPQNITYFFGPVESPQIQQGSPKSSQISGSLSLDIKAVNEFITKLKSDVQSINISQNEKKEIDSEIRTLEAQIDSTKPKSGIIKESRQSIRRVLEGAGGGVATQVLLEIGKMLIKCEFCQQWH